MKKFAAIMILFSIFLILIVSVSSLKTFEINETEKISLAPEAEDADADALAYTFTKPLDENGEWLTTYGDAGEYSTTVTVSDGVNEASEEVLIIVRRKDESPTIDSFEPESDVVINEGENVRFKVEASDLNEDELSYEWRLNDEFASNEKQIVFETGYKNAGSYVVSVSVSDSMFNVAKEWKVNVQDVDLDAVLAGIEDVSVTETNVARLKLPNFRQYGLEHEISDPIGNDNRWKTGYDDAGEYEVTIKVKGKDFEGEKKVKVVVANKDRAPKFVGLGNANVKENEVLNIELKAEDPDDDIISFSAENIPEGSELIDNVFVWNPGFDFIQKEKPEDYVLDAFKLLNKKVEVTFIAKSKNLEDKKTITITVKDGNRPFVLEPIEDIEVGEGEEIVINPAYNDPDNDKVSFRYSGFMNKNTKITGFDDAGSYVIKVIASDGNFEQTKFVNVKVNDINRKPEFFGLKDAMVKEGDELRIALDADDDDNDKVSYGIASLPKDAELNGNVFTWEPDFDVVFNETSKDFGLEFIVSDGKEETRQKIVATVLDKNKAPQIIDFSDDLVAFKDEPVSFWVEVLDVDEDDLEYEWSFGYLDKFAGEKEHQRIFTTTGSKKVKVTVSDGMKKAEKVWNVEVV